MYEGKAPPDMFWIVGYISLHMQPTFLLMMYPGGTFRDIAMATAVLVRL